MFVQSAEFSETHYFCANFNYGT